MLFVKPPEGPLSPTGIASGASSPHPSRTIAFQIPRIFRATFPRLRSL